MSSPSLGINEIIAVSPHQITAPYTSSNDNSDTRGHAQENTPVTSRRILEPASRIVSTTSSASSTSVPAAVPKPKTRTRGVAILIGKQLAPPPPKPRKRKAQSFILDAPAPKKIKRARKEKAENDSKNSKPSKPNKLAELKKKHISTVVTAKLPQVDLKKRKEEQSHLSSHNALGLNHEQRNKPLNVGEIQTGPPEEHLRQIRNKSPSAIRRMKAALGTDTQTKPLRRPREKREVPKEQVVAPKVLSYQDPNIPDATWHQIPKSVAIWIKIGNSQVPWARILEAPSQYPYILVYPEKLVYRITKMKEDEIDKLLTTMDTRKEAARKAAATKRDYRKNRYTATNAAIALGLRAPIDRNTGGLAVKANLDRENKVLVDTLRKDFGSSGGPDGRLHIVGPLRHKRIIRT